MNTSEILNKAADLIEERGWRQGPAGWGGSGGASLCLEGGIAAAMGLRIDYAEEDEKLTATHTPLRKCSAYTAVVSYLDLDDSPWTWNDEGDRTKEEVIEVLRATALIEQVREGVHVSA